MSFILINHLDCTVMQLLLGRITLSWTKTCLSKAIVQRTERALWSGICTGYCLKLLKNVLRLKIEDSLKLTFSPRDPSPWEGVICRFYCLLVPQKHTLKLYQSKEGVHFPWVSMQQWEETGSVTQDLAQDLWSHIQTPHTVSVWLRWHQ